MHVRAWPVSMCVNKPRQLDKLTSLYLGFCVESSVVSLIVVVLLSCCCCGLSETLIKTLALEQNILHLIQNILYLSKTFFVCKTKSMCLVILNISSVFVCMYVCALACTCMEYFYLIEMFNHSFAL